MTLTKTKKITKLASRCIPSGVVRENGASNAMVYILLSCHKSFSKDWIVNESRT